MRAIVLAIGGIGLGLAGAAGAQTAKNTPEGIVCAMTGSCDAPTDGSGRVAVGGEKAFSLARPAGAAPTTPRSLTPAMPQPRTGMAPTRMTRTTGASTRTAPARVVPGGGVDMQVTFPRGSAAMTAPAQAEARAFALAMAAPQMAGMNFRIEGHTDSTGARQKNVELSQQRAQSVVDYLVRQGVPASRLTAQGFGPDKPLPGRPASAAANRRVEFVKGS